jgi:hypothetical protein
LNPIKTEERGLLTILFDSDLIDAVIIRIAKKGGHLLWTLDERILKNIESSQLFHPE